jgi:hypothetical protein
MILSLMGNGFSSLLTRANSCSGPKTSSGLYVKAHFTGWMLLFGLLEFLNVADADIYLIPRRPESESYQVRRDESGYDGGYSEAG